MQAPSPAASFFSKCFPFLFFSGCFTTPLTRRKRVAQVLQLVSPGNPVLLLLTRKVFPPVPHFTVWYRNYTLPSAVAAPRVNYLSYLSFGVNSNDRRVLKYIKIIIVPQAHHSLLHLSDLPKSSSLPRCLRKQAHQTVIQMIHQELIYNYASAQVKIKCLHATRSVSCVQLLPSKQIETEGYGCVTYNSKELNVS